MFSLFRHKATVKPVALRIDDIPAAPLTPEPDDAELAAAALLEHMCDVRGKREDTEGKHQPSAISHQTSDVRDAAYYRAIADRIAAAHQAEARAALRYVAYCEQQLAATPPKGGLGGLEVGLYKRLDTIEREGDELKRRWQHCLADVTVRMMSKN